MRKTILALVVLLLTTPLYAGTITFTATDNANGTCTISYDSGTDPAPVAMGLDVDASAALTDFAVDSFFDIYIDAAFDLAGAYTYGDGTPIAEQDEAGEATLPLASFCISMGGLGGDVEPLDPAPTTGTIVLTGPACTGTITASTLRTGLAGTGVVDVEGNAMTTNLPLPFSITLGEETCYIGHGQTDEQMWIDMGRPRSWCYPRQCNGDADNIKEIVPPFDEFWVYNLDVGILVDGYAQVYNGDPVAQPWIAADFDHLKEIVPPFDEFRVYNNDVTILVNNYAQATVGDTCCPGCL